MPSRGVSGDGWGDEVVSVDGVAGVWSAAGRARMCSGWRRPYFLRKRYRAMRETRTSQVRSMKSSRS